MNFTINKLQKLDDALRETGETGDTGDTGDTGLAGSTVFRDKIKPKLGQ